MARPWKYSSLDPNAPLTLPTLQPLSSSAPAVSITIIVSSPSAPTPPAATPPLPAPPVPTVTSLTTSLILSVVPPALQPSTVQPAPSSISSAMPILTTTSSSVLSTSKAPIASSPIESAPPSSSTSMASSAAEPSSRPLTSPVTSVEPSLTTSVVPNSASPIPETQTSPIDLPSSVTSPNRRAAIGGLVAGALLFLAILAAVLFVFKKRYRRRDEESFVVPSVPSSRDGRSSPPFMSTPEKGMIEMTSDLSTFEKSFFESSTEDVVHFGPTPWSEEQRNQIIAMAEKRKEQILAEKKLLAVNRFTRLDRFKRQTMAMPKKLRSSLLRKEEGESREASISLPPPPRPNRSSTLSQFHVPIVNDQDETDYISQSPLIEPTRPSSEYSQDEPWDSLSTISEVSHANQDKARIEDTCYSKRSSVTHRISDLVVPRQLNLRSRRATLESYSSKVSSHNDERRNSSESYSSKVSSNDDDDEYGDNGRGRGNSRGLENNGRSGSIPVMLEIPVRNPARLTRSNSVQTARSRAMSTVSNSSLGII